MTYSCPYCDQTLLKDETVCWQCGRQVQSTTAGRPAQATAAPGRDRAASLSPLAVYSGLTGLLIIATLLTTVYLGRQPRLQAGQTELPSGWRWIRENSSDFLLFLPESWEYIDPENEAGEASLKGYFQAQARWQWITEPLGAVDEALTPLFLAQGVAPPEDPAGVEAIVLVASSRLLNRLTPAEMVALAEELAAETELTLIQNERIPLLPGIEVEHVSLLVEKAGAEGTATFRCRQQLIPGTLQTLFISACTEADEQAQETTRNIVSSFQRLAP